VGLGRYVLRKNLCCHSSVNKSSQHLSHGDAYAVEHQTTLARRLFEELGGAENVCYLFHDSYYRDISHKTFEERAKTNFDHPDSLETGLLLRHLQDLKAGQGCQVPTYDFSTHSRTGVCVDMQPKSIIIVEGILLFTHADLINELDVKVFVVRSLSREGNGHFRRVTGEKLMFTIVLDRMRNLTFD